VQHFDNKEFGDVDVLPGTMQGHRFFLFAMKDTPYVLSIMSTYGTTARIGQEHPHDYTAKKIVYPECISNHYTYHDSVNANNRDQMYPIALEEVWKMT